MTLCGSCDIHIMIVHVKQWQSHEIIDNHMKHHDITNLYIMWHLKFTTTHMIYIYIMWHTDTPHIFITTVC